MFSWFGPKHCADLFVDASETSCVHLAAQDLVRDVKTVSGKTTTVKPYLPSGEQKCIVLGSIDNPGFRAWIEDRIDPASFALEWEGYRILIEKKFLIIAGSNKRGTMWGIYHLSKQFLKIDPCYLFTGYRPCAQETLSLEEGTIAGAPVSYKFRGWFLNDEDLLSDWMEGGGARHIDYPFYDQVTHPNAIQMVLETAVRLGINLIIPASFVDIQNPPEENLVRMVTERGLFVTQHHVEPIGVSHFGFENYWKKQGMTEAFSFVTNRDKVIECWRSSIRKWARYDDVIWQLGLRGRGDRPAWFHDKAIGDSDEAHGALISDAMQTQYDLIAEELGTTDFISSATMWFEGSELMYKGCLTFPRDTIIVFADAGHTQLFSKDFFEQKRLPEHRYGLYYHVAFWGAGPHLVQAADLRKMQFQYKMAMDMGDHEYSILNVANVREVILSVQANAEMIWDIESFDETEYLNRYFRQHFELNGGAELMHRHFDAFADDPIAHQKELDDYARYWNVQTELKNVDFKQRVILDGVAREYALEALRWIGGKDFDHDFAHALVCELSKGIEAFEQSYSALCRAYPTVPEKGKAFYRDMMLVQEEIMLGLYHWAKSCILASLSVLEEDHAAAAAYLRHAVFSMEKLLEDRRKAEHGCFINWYRGDRKMNLPGELNKTYQVFQKLES